MRILSWNLLRFDGARPEDVTRLVEEHRPDLVLMQETIPAFAALPRLLGGGTFHRHPMPGRGHGPAAWSPEPFDARSVLLPLATRLDLPSPLLRTIRRRSAQLLSWRGVSIANVHLDHGQRANRRQLAALLSAEPALSLVIGDFNMIGHDRLPGFRDRGPRAWTHLAWNLVPLRLDRCLSRDLRVTARAALARGRSDHRPILLDLEPSVTIRDA
ncbi:MAG: endonuclease/exonuclease/phosphatase family protein [Gluconacetobacter diazotrophicus]|nr:endonuclease/exonuclease/phosphatase family protein [Gluconacetobacter diazotrophicus]